MKSVFVIVLVFLVGLSISAPGPIDCSTTSSECFQKWKEVIAQVTAQTSEKISICAHGGKPKATINSKGAYMFKGPIEILTNGHAHGSLAAILKPDGKIVFKISH